MEDTELIELLYNYAYEYYNKNYSNCDDTYREKYTFFLNQTLQEWKIKLENIENDTFLSLNQVETKILRMKYCIFHNGEKIKYYNITDEYGMPYTSIMKHLDYIFSILARKLIDIINYKLNGIPPKTTISDLNISFNLKQLLTKEGIFYIEDLIKLKRNDLQSIKRIGKISIDSIINSVHEFGFEFVFEQDNDAPDEQSYLLLNQKRKELYELLEMKNEICKQIKLLQEKNSIIEEKIRAITSDINEIEGHNKKI